MRTITIANHFRGLRIDRRALARVIDALDSTPHTFDGGCPAGELSIVFLGDAALAELHDRFLQDPSTTDVITFEGDPLLEQAGEICVSVDTARAFAKRHSRKWQEELLLYVIHGWLHLAGYDDLQPSLKRVMRRAEARALRIALQLCPRPVFSVQGKSRP